MTDKIKVHDRVIITKSELNPLANIYVLKEFNDSFKCEFNYGIISGEIDVLKNKVLKHPIQISEFTFELEINGNDVPKTNDFSIYFKNFNDWTLLFRMSAICFKELLKNITDSRNLRLINEILNECLTSTKAVEQLDSWIMGSIKNFPPNYRCKSVIEFSGETPKAIYNSENIFNNNVTTLFLLYFTWLVLQLNLITKESLLSLLKSNA